MCDDQSLTSRKSGITQLSGGSSNPFRDASDCPSTDQHRMPYQPPKVAKREEANILRAKVLVALIILIAAGAVGTSTYLLVKDQERTNFENQFTGYASEIVTVSRQKADQFFLALDSFSASISSQAISDMDEHNTSWPFYTIPDWAIKAKRLADLTGVSHPEVAMAPIVQPEDRDKFNAFAAEAVPKWYRESVEYEGTDMTADEFMQKTVPFIYFHDTENNYQPTPVTSPNESLPLLQSYPLFFYPEQYLMTTMLDTMTASRNAALASISRVLRKPTIGFEIMFDGDTPITGSQIIQPIYDTADTEAEDRKMVAFTGIRLHWLDYFKNILTDGEFGVIVVLKSSCGDVKNTVSNNEISSVVSYRIDGQNALHLGDSDVHNPKYDDMKVDNVFVDLEIDESQLPGGVCIPTLTMHVYPSEDLEESFFTSNAILYTSMVVVIFIFTSLVFLLYDYFVRRRQTKVMERITRQDKIVANVFPTAIRDRLYQNQEEQNKKKKQKSNKSTKNLHQDDFNDSIGDLDFEGDSNLSGSAPLADLFPSVTLIFADIAGFTAWSSAREPQQVFVLLETIYSAFDKIAYRHNVFKVETVGDCYVAAVGLPEPVDNHAIVGCKFAQDCLKKMKEVTLKLEVTLGPDTGDLDLRTGVHSGQVTAGVLRGERSRFQLFGDTMNTASRMEHTGERNRIQLSQATADMLTEAGLAQWIKPRGSKIFVKGKGDMQTYWLRKAKARKSKVSDAKIDMATVAESIDTADESESIEEIVLGFEGDTDQAMTKIDRLVEWNVEVLSSLLQQIIASRGGVVNEIGSLSEAEKRIGSGGGTVLDEFTPIIPLKRFDTEHLRARRRPSSIEIGDAAKSQLRMYLSQIAGMYRDNPFHNFQHASHVTASVKKLLTRIVKLGEGNGLAENSQRKANHVNLVDLAGHSYGITSDPLTQFAVVFSAIIHDVDHPGVPNAQLVKEQTRNAQIYKKSVAEQNSVELAWDMLMSGEFSELRACIYQTESDLRRFRQLVVNTVMATDIVDKELQALRKNRWEAAFSNDASHLSSTSIDNNEGQEQEQEHEDRKATIVIEHLIQASDVSHTMQHWHIYQEWNERFFIECYRAYKEGRAGSDPSENWYKGEIGFFDFYVVPLAKKLQSCGVFGVSSDEYLTYAKQNRDEWVREGEAMVQHYLEKYNSEGLRNL
eukprot:scaffold5995_cov113-Cylindrotheca_fusiformis.AAC.1